MATLKTIDYAIRTVLSEKLYDPIDILLRVNTAVTRIAAGIKLPDGRVSPPLPDLFSSGTVSTDTSAAMASLPDTYQRNLTMVADSNDEMILPPSGGDYYSFNTFLRRARYKDLSETGSVYTACVKGSNLYYQGIPSTSTDLLVYFYRKPVDMDDYATDTPDGIPEPYQLDLLKQFVCAEVFGDQGKEFKDKRNWHMSKFYGILDEMMQFVGEAEGEPMYFYNDGGY